MRVGVRKATECEKALESSLPIPLQRSLVSRVRSQVIPAVRDGSEGVLFVACPSSLVFCGTEYRVATVIRVTEEMERRRKITSRSFCLTGVREARSLLGN